MFEKLKIWAKAHCRRDGQQKEQTDTPGRTETLKMLLRRCFGNCFYSSQESDVPTNPHNPSVETVSQNELEKKASAAPATKREFSRYLTMIGETGRPFHPVETRPDHNLSNMSEDQQASKLYAFDDDASSINSTAEFDGLVRVDVNVLIKLGNGDSMEPVAKAIGRDGDLDAILAYDGPMENDPLFQIVSVVAPRTLDRKGNILPMKRTPAQVDGQILEWNAQALI